MASEGAGVYRRSRASDKRDGKQAVCGIVLEFVVNDLVFKCRGVEVSAEFIGTRHLTSMNFWTFPDPKFEAGRDGQAISA